MAVFLCNNCIQWACPLLMDTPSEYNGYHGYEVIHALYSPGHLVIKQARPIPFCSRSVQSCIHMQQCQYLFSTPRQLITNNVNTSHKVMCVFPWCFQIGSLRDFLYYWCAWRAGDPLSHVPNLKITPTNEAAGEYDRGGLEICEGGLSNVWHLSLFRTP